MNETLQTTQFQNNGQIRYPTITLWARDGDLLTTATMAICEHYGPDICAINKLTDPKAHSGQVLHLEENCALASTSWQFNLLAVSICDMLREQEQIKAMHLVKHGSNGPEASEIRIVVLSKTAPSPA